MATNRIARVEHVVGLPPATRKSARDHRDSGYLRVYRSLAESWLWKDSTRFDVRSAFVDLLLFARFKDSSYPYTRTVGGRDDAVAVRRGEFIASLRFLATRWRWGTKRVSDFLARLIAHNTLVFVRRTPLGNVYRFMNYDVYQTADTAASITSVIIPAAMLTDAVGANGTSPIPNPARKTPQFSGPAPMPGFLRCRAIYPKRNGSQKWPLAEHAYRQCVDASVDEQHLFVRTIAYAMTMAARGKTGSEFVMMAATFFNARQRAFDDESLDRCASIVAAVIDDPDNALDLGAVDGTTEAGRACLDEILHAAQRRFNSAVDDARRQQRYRDMGLPPG